MRNIVQEFRYALRQLRKSTAFTITAVLTLAFGIGANIAVFSVMNAVLVNPTGIPHAQGLVTLLAKYSLGGLNAIDVSAPDFQDALDAHQIFTSAAAMQPGSFNYTGDDARPVRLQTAKVTSQFFDVFQVKPQLGRTFRPEDDVPDSNYSVVLSYRTWKGRFGGDPNIVGRKLQLNEQSYEVIGVMGPEFGWPNDAEMWTPLALPPQRYHDPNYRHNENLFGVARLQPGMSVDQANAYYQKRVHDVIAGEGATSFSIRAGWGEYCMPLMDYIAGDLRKPLFLLLGAVALVLLIAAFNIAGLQLARASDRQREVAISIAIGASRVRLIRQAFVESFLLACGGLALGVILARTVIPLLLLLAPEDLVRNLQIQLQTPVLLFVCLVVLACVLVCGAAPAWQMTRVKWVQCLRDGGRGDTAGQGKQRLRSALVICEIAVAMLLLVSAGLLLTSLRRVEQVQTGFDPSGLMSGRVSLPKATYISNEKQAAFYTAALDQLKSLPGIRDAAFADSLPFDNQGGAASFTIKSKPLSPGDPGPHGKIRDISPDYFQTLRIPLLRGRYFTPQDGANSQLVAIIDDTLARQYWPHEDPLGQQIGFDEKDNKWMTIVGIVKHSRISSLDADTAEGVYYESMAQDPTRNAAIVIRTASSHPEQYQSAIERAIHNVDPNQPVYDFKTMEQRVDDSLVSRRFLVVLLSSFAGLSLFLAVLGLYGVVTYMVKMRVREIGVRIALGAQKGDVLQMILKTGIRLAIVGSVLGVFGAFVAGRALSSMLYEVHLYNPVTLAATSVLLGIVVLFASYLPARRAANVDPMESLRDN